MWGSEFTSKDATLQREMMVALMPLFAAALVVRRRYFIVAPRPFSAAPLVVRRRCLIVVPRPMPAAQRMYLIVVYRLLPYTRIHLHAFLNGAYLVCRSATRMASCYKRRVFFWGQMFKYS